MNLQSKRIAIIGGGPGGLTLARLLQLKGALVHVYERDVDASARVQGSPLDLHENSGLAALAKAELMEVFRSNYMAGADRMKILNEQAEVLFSDHETKAAENFGYKYFRPEIDRGVLRKILLNALQPGTVIWNSHFLSMDRQGDGWLLHFKNSEPVYADIVVGADGANSRIRPYITGIKAIYSGITMLEGNVYNATEAVPEIAQLLGGGKIMAFGNGKDMLMGQKANNEIGFYASFKADENWVAASGPDFADRNAVLDWFKAAYPEWSNIWHQLFHHAALPFIPRPIYCMPLDQTWAAQPNVTIIGDAAHVMPPFAGEGVNMAMLDALELSEVLTDAGHQDMQNAIATFESRMRLRASNAARESLENGERMHSKEALSIMLHFFSRPALG